MKKAIKVISILLGGVCALLFIAWLIAPTGPREQMQFNDPYRTKRPAAESRNFMASSGNPWTTRTALDVMSNGGNAFDAAAAALLVLNVTYGEAASFPGVAPLLIYLNRENKIKGYCGAGTAPQKATIKFFRDAGFDTVPDTHILAQLLPASPDVLIALLQEHGTWSFEKISAYAVKLAEEGFPVHSMMLNNLDLNIIERLGFSILMPYNVQVYLRGEWWRPLHHKDRFIRPDLARTLKAMAGAESAALQKGKSRTQALAAVRDYFYRGPVAEAITSFHKKYGGLFTKKDLASYRGYWEEPVSGSFGPYQIYSNRTWCQGPVVPLVLQFLEGIDLKALGHNSPRYIHTVIQAIELAMADREAYFGDPAFADVPLQQLMSRGYASRRAKAMIDRAFGKMPEPGKIPGHTPGGKKIAPEKIVEGSNSFVRDTSYLSIIDRHGNAVSLTPSDFPKSPMVPGTGLTLGIRMTQFRLDPNHPAALMPGKRPRITPNPGMVTKNGKFFMTFGTPGGDMQTQAMIQVFLNIALFGMNPQEAIDAPRFKSLNFPDSFSPHEYRPGVIVLEQNLYDKVYRALKEKGYQVKKKEKWHYSFGGLCAIIKDPETGKLIGGADPREVSWAEGR